MGRFLLCPVCKKTQASLSVHLTRVCMKRSSKEAIREVMEKAKKDVLEVLQWGRVFSYRHLREIMDDDDPMSRMIQELEHRHMVVTDTPSPAVVAQSSSVPVVAGTATNAQRSESAESEQSEDIVSGGETFQVARDVRWPQTSRHMMQEKGLYRKHSLDHPLLKGFATYLEKALLNENFKQEVENVSRFMFFVNPEEPSLEFVREKEKMKLFIRQLSEAGLSGQTQMNYLKSLKRFLKCHTVITNLRHDSRGLWKDAKCFMKDLSSLQQSCGKLVSKEIIQRRHAIRTEKNPLNPEDCWAVLRAAKNDFLAVVAKVYPEETPLELNECCVLLYYLEATVILKHLQQRGVVEHMTVQEWKKRTRDESGYTVIGVKEHRLSTRRVPSFALSSEEERWFDIYFSHLRPQLLASNWSKRTTDQAGDERFFVSTTGRPIYNASNDLHRLHQKYQLDPVTSQTARRVFGTASKNMTDSEETLVADYLTHSSATAQNVVAASKLLSKLAGDLSASSAEEGTVRATRGTARNAAPGSNQQTDVQAAFDRLLQTHPVTLDGDVPDKTVRSQTSDQFKRQLYERWLKAQMKLRVQHVLSHFGRREPTESRVNVWIKKQGWESNIPSAARILKDWKPTGSLKTAMDSRCIQKLVTTQKWKGLVLADIVGKGKGVCTTRHFQAGEVVCDYHGRVVTATEGWQIHQAATEEQNGCMFFFKNRKNNHMCIDACAPQCECHPEKQTFGRLINHSRKKANIRPRLYTVEMDGKEQDVILFLARRKIAVGEELRFDFGVERKSFRGEGLDLCWL